MKERKIDQYRESSRTRDGAGVNLNRIFHGEGVFNLDPFLMLDTFDSFDPNDYLRGFPVHPHRGIETFTYLVKGEITHKDSLGNKGVIKDGEYQWMRAGSGILHEEMPQACPHMLGFQLWINMPKSQKMSDPVYLEGVEGNIPEAEGDGYKVRVLSGSFGDKTRELPSYVKVDIFDISLDANQTIMVSTHLDYKVFVSILQGTAQVAGKTMVDKSAATLVDGDTVKISSGTKPVRVMFFAAKPLNEPIAWGGPIVMNTQEELRVANQELNDGTFIKHEAKI